MTEPRKATDVLIELESKIDTLISLIKTQDLNFKIISNKLNEIMEAAKKQSEAPKFTAATPNTTPTFPPPSLDPERYVRVSAESAIPSTNAPEGFRRTSRPETFGNQGAGEQTLAQPAQKIEKLGDGIAQPKVPQSSQKYPLQLPKGMPPPGRTAGENVADVVFPQHPSSTHLKSPATPPAPSQANKPVVQNAVPVMQRVIDKNAKTVFMANVEIVDLATAQPVFKTRTNGTGKWQASLPVGDYRITIKKGEGLTKAGLEAIQDIKVDGSISPYELKQLILK
jgi:hypothetical protein